MKTVTQSTISFTSTLVSSSRGMGSLEVHAFWAVGFSREALSAMLEAIYGLDCEEGVGLVGLDVAEAQTCKGVLTISGQFTIQV